MTPKVSIFVVSFKRDLPFVGYLCKSYEKYCKGFHEFVIAVPRDDEHLFLPLVARFGIKLVAYVDNYEKPFLRHQVIKLNADRYCTGDYIMHVDSDCAFWQDCTPEFYFKDGQPILYREKFATVVNKIRLNWKDAVKAAVGYDCDYDYMVRHPAVHVRCLYPTVRQEIEIRTRMSMADYVMTCQNSFPQSFAEHPTQGAVVERRCAHLYHLVDFDVTTPDGGYQYDKSRDALVANWSHHGWEHYRDMLDEIIA